MSDSEVLQSDPRQPTGLRLTQRYLRLSTAVGIVYAAFLMVAPLRVRVFEGELFQPKCDVLAAITSVWLCLP